MGDVCLGMDWSILRIMMLKFQNLAIVLITRLIVNGDILSKPTSSECLQFDGVLSSAFSLSLLLFA